MLEYTSAMRTRIGRRQQTFLAGVLVLFLSPIVILNGLVMFFGNTVIFPLSPFHLENKLLALRAYALHRPGCLFYGHEDLHQHVRRAEKKHRLPAGLLKALVHVESSDSVHRISRAGAMGPSQLMPDTAADLKVRDPFDPEQSIDGGARYLSRQLKRYGDVRLALAAYNAGPGHVRKKVPRNGETEHYVRKVLAECERRAERTSRASSGCAILAARPREVREGQLPR